MAEHPFDVIAGVHLGKKGAIAFITDNLELLSVIDVPVIFEDPDVRSSVDTWNLAAIIRNWKPHKAFIERVNIPDGTSAKRHFALKGAEAAIEGLLGGKPIPYTFVNPNTWKTKLGIPASRQNAKDAALSEAIRRWPEHTKTFLAGKDDSRYKACLIAVSGALNENNLQIKNARRKKEEKSNQLCLFFSF